MVFPTIRVTVYKTSGECVTLDLPKDACVRAVKRALKEIAPSPNIDHRLLCNDVEVTSAMHIRDLAKVPDWFVIGDIVRNKLLPLELEMNLVREYPVCENCKQSSDGSSKPFQRCSACRLTYYCSRNCQKLDWRHHKHVCS